MSERTVRLHRVFRTKPEHVYRAFLEPDAAGHVTVVLSQRIGDAGLQARLDFHPNTPVSDKLAGFVEHWFTTDVKPLAGAVKIRALERKV